MPRIAAALGVFATLVFCVGFNVVQYPAVWRMVASPTASSPPHQAAPPAASPQPSAAAKAVPIAVPPQSPGSAAQAMAKPAPAVPAMASSMPVAAKPVCDPVTGVCHLPTASISEESTKNTAPSADRSAPISLPNDQAASKVAAASKADKPAATTTKKKAAPIAAAKASPPAGKAAPIASTEKGLVPVVRAPKSPKAAAKTPGFAKGFGAGEANREPKMVRRLPPVDDTPPVALSDDGLTSNRQIPIYPSTTVR